MTIRLKKAALSALAALTLGAAVTVTATPSAAQNWRGTYRWHAGYWYGGNGWGGGFYGWASRSQRPSLAASRSAPSPHRPIRMVRFIMAAAIGRTGLFMTAGAISPAMRPSKPATEGKAMMTGIDFSYLARSPFSGRDFNFFYF